MIKNKKYTLFLLFLLSLIFYPTYARADLVWPAIYIMTGSLSLFVIALGLATEILFVKFFAKISWKKAIKLGFIMNLITGALGILLIPVAGVGLEIFFFIVAIFLPMRSKFIGTFHGSHWVVSFLSVVLLNTFIEGKFLGKQLNLPLKKIFWWLFCANLCSVLYCVFYLFICKEKTPYIFW